MLQPVFVVNPWMPNGTSSRVSPGFADHIHPHAAGDSRGSKPSSDTGNSKLVQPLFARQRESWIEEGHLIPDPRAHADQDPTGVLGGACVWVHQGKNAIYIAPTFMERKRDFVGQHSWARAFFVSGRDETVTCATSVARKMTPREATNSTC